MHKIPIVDIQHLSKIEYLNDFNVNLLSSHLEENNETSASFHKHNFFFCVLFTKGRGTHKIDFDTYSIEPGSVFFLKPGQTHYWEFEIPPEGYIFSHTQDFYENPYLNEKLNQFPFYRSNKNPPSLILSQQETDNLKPRFEELMNEYYNNSVYKKSKIFSLINLIYIGLSRLYISLDKSVKIVSPINMKIITKLEVAIEAHYKDEKLPRFYANKLFVTTKHLNRVIKTSLNKTTTDLIIERVVLEAKRLMVYSENSLTTISYILGYQDYAYFSRLFKRKTGISPKKFIKVIDR